MGTPRRSGWRSAIGAIVMLAIASGLLVGTATIAEAKQINSVDQLEKSCSKGTGSFSRSKTTGICVVKGGSVTCVNKTPKGVPKCTGHRYRSLAPTDTVRAPNGVELTTQAVPDSQIWRQRLSIPALTDTVCPGLDGEFVASADATIGACAAPTAKIICTDAPGTNCLGIAGTEKQADSIPKQINTAVATAGLRRRRRQQRRQRRRRVATRLRQRGSA